MTQKEFRDLRKKAGVCRDCGKEDAYTMAGRTYCAECAEKDRLRKEEARKCPEKRQKCLHSTVKWRHARKPLVCARAAGKDWLCQGKPCVVYACGSSGATNMLAAMSRDKGHGQKGRTAKGASYAVSPASQEGSYAKNT